MTWVSRGTMSFDAGTFFQMPKSTASLRTIHRRKRFSLLHAPPHDGREKKYADTWTGRAAAICGPQVGLQRARRERFERRRQIGRGSIVALKEERLDRPLLQHPLKDDDERRQIVALRPPMNDAASRSRACRAGSKDRTYAAGDAPSPQEAFDRLQHARNAPKGERRRAESSDFPVRGIVEAAHELDGIGGRIDAVERRVERVEPFFEQRSGETRGSLKRCERSVRRVVHVDRASAHEGGRDAAFEVPSGKGSIARLRSERRRIDRDRKVGRENRHVCDCAFAQRTRGDVEDAGGVGGQQLDEPWQPYEPWMHEPIEAD